MFLGCEKTLESPERRPYEDDGPVINTSIDASKRLTGGGGFTSPGVYPISAESKTQIKINNLDGNNVYLIHVNESGAILDDKDTKIVSTWEKSDSSAGETNLAPAGEKAEYMAEGIGPDEVKPVRYDFEDAINFKPLLRARERVGGNAVSRAHNLLPSASLVDTDSFYVNISYKNFWIRRETGAKDWYQLPATLRAKNENCFVWVADENFDFDIIGNDSDNKMSNAQAVEFANKFSLIYQKETALFGYEYGGGPDGDGGVDRLKPVQILAYDIGEDFKPEQSGGVVGYFWLKDEYTEEELAGMNTLGETYKTNAAEIFYMDVHFIDKYPDMAYSTLIHEFQHMIHYNQKNVIHMKPSSTWYNEMLSMLAEDVLCEYLNIQPNNQAHPISTRIPMFLGTYSNSGVTEWRNGDYSLYSYASSYAFGAYLARNFGGASLIREIITNNAVDEASVIMAVKSVNTGLDSWTFSTLLEKFAETIVFTGTAGNNMSLNKTHTKAVSGVNYTFKGFDISTIPVSRTYSESINHVGPVYFKPNGAWSLRPNTFAAVFDNSWKNINGTLTLNLNKPYANTKLYIMIK